MKSAMFKQLSGKVENLEFRNILVDNETAGANVLAETTHNANVKNVHFNGITLRRRRVHRYDWKRYRIDI